MSQPHLLKGIGRFHTRTPYNVGLKTIDAKKSPRRKTNKPTSYRAQTSKEDQRSSRRLYQGRRMRAKDHN